MTINESKALFAAGCFWGVQYYFDQVPGVTKTVAGYTGGHAEAVLIDFDPVKVSYETLVRQFFRMHDPTQLNRQGPDIGDNCRSAIFYFDDEQRQTVEMVMMDVAPQYDKPIVT
jgi:peptide methionine sulfoxide reductase msrA/msrB